jgi:hypothetical protein
MIVWTRTGAALVLQTLTARAAFLGLYTADVSPTPDMKTGADLGEVKPSTGYNRGELSPGSWRIDEGLGLAQHPKVDFQFASAPGKIFGCFVTDIGGAVIWIAPFASPRDFSEFGGRLGIIPTIRFRSSAI